MHYDIMTVKVYNYKHNITTSILGIPMYLQSNSTSIIYPAFPLTMNSVLSNF